MVDLSELYGLSNSEGYRRIWTIIQSIAELEFPSFFDEGMYEVRSDEFMAKSSRSVLKGCVGAVDGLIIQTKRPSLVDAPDTQKFYSDRYHFYGINVQAACDAKRRFIWFSAKVGAATNDSKAMAFSSFSDKVRELPYGYWVAGDAAYKSFPGIITPYEKGCTEREDDFNFYLSQLRINIECAFGIFVRRFGVFWRPLLFPLDKITWIVQAAMIIHNMIIDARDDRRDLKTVEKETLIGLEESNPNSTTRFPGRFESSSLINVSVSMSSIDGDVETSAREVPTYSLPEDREYTRFALCTAVHAAGMKRPKKLGRRSRAQVRVLGDITNTV